MTETAPAALVLAAGKSTRMGSDKAILPLGGVPVVQRVVGLFHRAGVTDVRVVVGHHGERIAPAVRQAGARAVFNPGFEGGMFTSVAAGLQTLDPGCPGVFILPVDLPLVRVHTILGLLQAWRDLPATGGREKDAGCAILHPIYRGLRGHPPFIGGGHIPEILKWRGDGGLRACLAQHPEAAREVPVADRFIMADMDTPEDYDRMARDCLGEDVPSPEECRVLMEEVMAVPPPVWAHCRAVADTAVILGRALNRAKSPGGPLSLPLIRAAALVHDLARDQPDHARAGAERLRALGFPALADIVAVHMELPPDREERLEAAEVVFLADKLVAGDVRVTLEERFRRQAARFGGAPEAAAGIARRLAQARRVRDAIEGCLGRSVAGLFAEGAHDLSASALRD